MRLPLLLLALISSALCAEQITTRNDIVGRSLQQWWDAGTAAGFDALMYENHDGNHSPLNSLLYPRLRHYKPTAEEIKTGKDKGLLDAIRPEPTIGNTSMAGAPDQVGSLPRVYLTDRAGSEFLFKQYLANNLHIYPEHLDHDPGANGIGGWGDLYPVNTTCLLISQGSSLSDQPFVRTMLTIAASLPPDIQRTLIRNRILMPTLQAVFRQNTTLLKNEQDYFTGKAHPPVFPESAIDELKMATAAQIMSRLSMPPVAFLEVLSERKVTAGSDFTDRPGINDEVICTTPSFIGRVFRGMNEVFDIKLSAKHSIDPEHRDLMYRWEVLQGDPALVKITPEKDGEEARIQVRWHPPMHASTGIRTHRVDIGLFVGAGGAWSAPAFLSIYMLPNEMRFFDARGRLTELIGEAGNPELGLPGSNNDDRWLSILERIGGVDDTLPRTLALSALSKEHLSAIRQSWEKIRPLKLALDKLPKDKRNEPGEARTRLTTATTQAITPAIQKALSEMIHTLADRTDLFVSSQEILLKLAATSSKSSALTDLRAELKRLTSLGILIEQADGTFTTAHKTSALTAADRYSLRQLHLTVLSEVLFPDWMLRSPKPLFVDPRLSTKRPWRDVFRYDDKGQRTGWMRHYQGRTLRFDADGRMLDANNKPSAVAYRIQDSHLIFDPASPTVGN